MHGVGENMHRPLSALFWLEHEGKVTSIQKIFSTSTDNAILSYFGADQ